jgi:hypothetical protein
MAQSRGAHGIENNHLMWLACRRVLNEWSASELLVKH